MNPSRKLLVLSTAVAAALALSACGKKEQPAPAPAPVAVASVDLGNAVGADQKVTTPATTFATTDTIYAAVATTGTAANAVLNAKWTFGDGQTVNESSQTIAPNGDAVTSFHISKPDGWPKGSYKVEISLDGKVVASKDFTVQ